MLTSVKATQHMDNTSDGLVHVEQATMFSMIFCRCEHLTDVSDVQHIFCNTEPSYEAERRRQTVRG